MSKADDVARRFREWMERCDHRDEAPSESFKTFIVADRRLAECRVSYAEYREIAEKVKSLGRGVGWVVPKDAFDLSVEESRRRILGRRRRSRGGRFAID